jgi:hypothetical protein
MYRFKIICTVPLFIGGLLYSQEALKSVEEEYYDFLALQGSIERPYLNYRTLSDSVWNSGESFSHLWENHNLGTLRHFFDDRLKLRIYGPELFMSANTAAPYGQNDGSLWQGKGFNTSLTGGIRLEGYGVAATFKPQLAFSQNLAFDYIQANPTYASYTDKAADYGYYGIPSIDAPQRFGNKHLFAYDWGDTEIRYTWKTLTIGFGTQPIWLGPAQINPIIHSNNAASYPKLDLGIRKQAITIPKVNWYIGDIEARAWWGYLTESDFFDNDSSNDHNLISGFSIAYGVPFLPGFSIGFNRTMLSKWENKDYKSFLSILIPKMDSDLGRDEQDQRGSLVFDYMIPSAGLEVYFEWGRNDYSPNMDFILRYPFHTEAYTFGIKKNLAFTDKYQGELLLEITNLESSRDYEIISWGTTFYAHHIILQGYTNKGQWIGAGIGTGGNSQYLGFKLFYPGGYCQAFIQRRNPDLDYTWFTDKTEYNIRASLDFGLSAQYFVFTNLAINLGLTISDEHNPLNISGKDSSNHRTNTRIAAGIKYRF